MSQLLEIDQTLHKQRRRVKPLPPQRHFVGRGTNCDSKEGHRPIAAQSIMALELALTFLQLQSPKLDLPKHCFRRMKPSPGVFKSLVNREGLGAVADFSGRRVTAS